MKILMSLSLVLVLSGSLFGDTIIYSDNYHSITTSSKTNLVTDQDRCQMEANYMAKNNITSHVFGTIGNFEGIGFGSSPNCNTCVPRNNMRLTGDASARGYNGKWYRVRSWRY